MLTSKPTVKHRGRQPPKHGPHDCPLCATKLRMGAALFCPKPGCEWKERD